MDYLRPADVRTMLVWRLKMENESDLALALEKCGTELRLRCTACGKPAFGEHRCKLRWCPVCQIKLAVERSKKIDELVQQMKWPLFVTLTRSNDDDMDTTGVRSLMKAFGKLRHKRIWRDQVKGGAATIEITNIGNGWHPHLHAIIDCRWLAIKTPEPRPSCSREMFQLSCKMAQAELSREWAKCLGQRMAVVWACRAKKGTIAKEIAKYAVKGSDLAECQGKIGPMLRAMKRCRMLRTFGTCFRFKFTPPEKTNGCPCDDCGAVGSMLPEAVYKWQYGTY